MNKLILLIIDLFYKPNYRHYGKWIFPVKNDKLK